MLARADGSAGSGGAGGCALFVILDTVQGCPLRDPTTEGRMVELLRAHLRRFRAPEEQFARPEL